MIKSLDFKILPDFKIQDQETTTVNWTWIVDYYEINSTIHHNSSAFNLSKYMQ